MAKLSLASVREALARIPARVAYALSPSHSRLHEDLGMGLGLGYGAYGYGIDPDDHLYRRITQAPRELPPVLQDRAVRLAWALYESNPLAHGIVEMMKDYVVGKGFAIRSSDPDLQSIIDKHWFDPINDWDLKQHDRIRDLSLFGELILLVFVNHADGHVRLAGLDPLHIRNVYTNVDNPEEIETLVYNPRRKVGGLSDSDKFYRVIHKDEDPGSATFGRMIGARTDAQGNIIESFHPEGGKKQYLYDGSIFFFPINKVLGALRGRGDLLSVIDWLDAYDQILFNFVDRTLLMNSFVWDVTLKGANRQQILTWRQDHGAVPKPGTVNIHDENEVWQEVSPKFARAEFETQQRSIKAQILNALGLPPHWFGEQITTRIGSIELGSPALKRLESRQTFVRHLFEDIYTFCFDQAVIAGKLPVPEADQASWPFTVTAPQMSNRDLAQATTSMLNTVQAIAIALTAGLVDQLEAQRIFVTIAGELGADINLDEMLSRSGAPLGTGFDPDVAAEPDDGTSAGADPMASATGPGLQKTPVPLAPVSSKANTNQKGTGVNTNPTGRKVRLAASARTNRPGHSHYFSETHEPVPTTIEESLAVLRARGIELVDGRMVITPPDDSSKELTPVGSS